MLKLDGLLTSEQNAIELSNCFSELRNLTEDLQSKRKVIRLQITTASDDDDDVYS